MKTTSRDTSLESLFIVVCHTNFCRKEPKTPAELPRLLGEAILCLYNTSQWNGVPALPGGSHRWQLPFVCGVATGSGDAQNTETCLLGFRGWGHQVAAVRGAAPNNSTFFRFPLPKFFTGGTAPEKLPGLTPIGKERLVFLSHHFSGSMLNFGGVCFRWPIFFFWLGSFVAHPKTPGVSSEDGPVAQGMPSQDSGQLGPEDMRHSQYI